MHIKNQQGFSIIEVLLAAAIFGFLATGLVGAIVYGRLSSADAGDHARAVFLAEEGAEAARNVGDNSYSNLPDGTYGLTQVSNQWNAAGTSDISGIYTRQITISTAGTNRKTITSTVTWPQSSGGTGTVTITTRLVNWLAGINLWSNAVQAGNANVTGNNNATKTDTVGNYAYTVLNATANNFAITNIANPAVPTIVSTTTLVGTPTNISVVGNYAYITNTNDTAELQVVDISVPTAPVLKASVNMTGTGNGQGVFVSGNYAYVVRAADVTTSANELTIVNITTPTTPTVVGGYNNNISMNEVYVSGADAYIATSSVTAEMLVVNVATPTAPTLAATYNPSTLLAALTITGFGNTVLLGMGTVLDAINITTPTAPARLDTFTAAGTINDIDHDITNQFAFVGTSSTASEFQIVDITNLSALSLTKTINITGTASTVSGVSYNNSLDEVVTANATDTQEVSVFTRN